MSNYSTTAPSEMSQATLALQIRMKEQRLAIRKEDHKSQEAAVLDRLRLSYDSLSSNNKATNAESGQMGVDLQHQPLSTPQDIPSILGALTSLRNQKIGDSSLQIYRLEYQKNCHSLGLFFLRLPGLSSRYRFQKAGRTAGFGLALLLAVLYWALLFAGQTLGYRQSVDPVFSMWMPNLVIFLTALVLWIIRKTSKGHFL